MKTCTLVPPKHAQMATAVSAGKLPDRLDRPNAICEDDKRDSQHLFVTTHPTPHVPHHACKQRHRRNDQREGRAWPAAGAQEEEAKEPASDERSDVKLRPSQRRRHHRVTDRRVRQGAHADEALRGAV